MAGSSNPLASKGFFPQFTGYSNNHATIEMYDKLMAQQFQIFGIPIDYVSSVVDPNKDRIFGEDTTKKYIQKHKLTCLLKEGQIEETLLFNGFGQVNTVEFSMYLHIGTFKKILGNKYDPKPSDQFFFPNGLSNLGFEVMHVGFSTLGLEGNILGQRTLYEIVVRERYVSEADEGLGEQYGVIQTVVIPSDWVGDLVTVVNNNALELITVTTDMVGKAYTIMVNDAPDDAILPDGRVASKYQIRGDNKRANQGDNKFIRGVTEGQPGALPDTGVFNEDGSLNDVRRSANVVQKDRSYWGEW